ncbi:MAG: peptidoglycan-binding protein [Elainellaceae cyanobacterium]
MSCRLKLLIATSLASCSIVSSNLILGASEVRFAPDKSSVSVITDGVPVADSAQASLVSTRLTEPQTPSSEVSPSDAEVAQLQTLLYQAGYYNGEIDGVYGNQTRLALIEFQRQFRLSDTGELDQETWQTLQELNPGTDISEFFKDNSTLASETGETVSEEDEASPDAPSSPEVDAGATVNTENAQQDWLNQFLIIAVVLGTGSIVTYALTYYGLIRIPRSRQISLFFRQFRARASRSSATPRTAASSHRFHRSNLASSTPASSQIRSLDTNRTGASKNNAESPSSDEPLLMVPTPVTPPSQTEIVRQLTLDLDHTDPNVRRKAIWELGQQGNSDAILPLIDLMATSDSHQRCLILAAVSEIGIRILKPMNRALIVSMQDENVDVRKNAIREITRIYDLVAQVNRHLRFAVNDVDAEVRKTAQWALQRIDRTLSESDSTLPELSTLVQSSEHGLETPSDNGRLSSVNRSSGDRTSSQ